MHVLAKQCAVLVLFDKMRAVVIEAAHRIVELLQHSLAVRVVQIGEIVREDRVGHANEPILIVVEETPVPQLDQVAVQVISVARNTMSPDGKTMTVAVTDTLHGTTSKFEAKKQ